MRASRRCTSWKLQIGWPNCSRSFEYLSASSKARLRDLEPRGAALDEEGLDVLGAVLDQLGVDHEDVGVGRVGDEGLLALQHEAVAVGARGRDHRAERVGAGARLGEAPGPDDLAAHEPRHPALDLRGRAVPADRARHLPVADAVGHQHAAAHARDLDADRGGDEELEAVLGRGRRHRRREVARARHAEPRGELLDVRVGQHVAVLHRLDVRRELRLDDAADGVTHGALRVGQLRVAVRHGILRTRARARRPRRSRACRSGCARSRARRGRRAGSCSRRGGARSARAGRPRSGGPPRAGAR